jgi:hypothetical protein
MRRFMFAAATLAALVVGTLVGRADRDGNHGDPVDAWVASLANSRSLTPEA